MGKVALLLLKIFKMNFLSFAQLLIKEAHGPIKAIKEVLLSNPYRQVPAETEKRKFRFLITDLVGLPGALAEKSSCLGYVHQMVMSLAFCSRAVRLSKTKMP